MRIMALDMGAKRVGVALSDEMCWTAGGLTVLERTPNRKFMVSLKELIEQHGVTRLLLGLPRRMDGTMGPEAEAVMELAEKFREELGVEVVTWDERLSTVAVERVLIEADMSRKKRKLVRDKVAAVYILQGYLDYLSSIPPEKR